MINRRVPINGKTCFSVEHEISFVKLLCLHKYAHPEHLLPQRNPIEYLRALKQYLLANSDRHDKIGMAGRQEAEIQIERLRKEGVK